MNVPRYAELAAKLLRTHAAREVAATGDRSRAVSNLESTMQRAAARRRLRWLGGAFAAALAAAWFGLWSGGSWSGVTNPALLSISVVSVGAGATVRSADHEQPLRAKALLSAGQTVQTGPQGGADLQLSTGSELRLAADAGLRVDEQGTTERFLLTRGKLSAHVAKLHAGQRFIVDTPDAEVEVRGTRFELSVLAPAEACSDGSRTRLHVSEGLVELRRAGVATRVAAGQTWPLECLPKASAAQPVSAAPSKPSDVQAASPNHASSPSTSALTRQNDLFAEGIALRRKGDVTGALAAYQLLISQFPSSPLAENAAVERVRLLAGTQPARARDEARAYLKRQPRGFAAEELRRIADEH